MARKRTMIDVDLFSYTTLKQQYRDEGHDLLWTMKDGTEIMIKDMADSHVKNTINMLRRKEYNGRREAWIDILESETLYRRSLKINKLKDNINLDDILRK